MSISGSDPGGALLSALIWIAVIAVVLGLLVWDARRRQVPSVVLDVTGAAARMWVALIVLGAVAGVMGLLLAPTTTITHVPISTDWPKSLPCQQPDSATFAGPTLYCAWIPMATAEVGALSVAVKTLLLIGGLFAYMLAALPGVLVAALCRHAAAGTPFARATGRWLLISSIIILIAGVGSELLLTAARYAAATEVLPSPEAAAAITAPSTFTLTIPVWPIGAALALAALAAIFRHGARLQRETDLLV